MKIDDKIKILSETDFDKCEIIINRIYKEQYVKKLEEENRKLQNNWNELKKFIEERNHYFTKDKLEMISNPLNGIDILTKIQEIERFVRL